MKLLRFFNTVKFLKYEQIFYQIYYRITYKKFKKKLYPTLGSNIKKDIYFLDKHGKQNQFVENKSFSFLNTNYKFSSIGWNSTKPEILWNYNLHYFDYINAPSYKNSYEAELYLINDWICKNHPDSSIGWSPYPLSLRVVNWIKWSIKNNYTEDIFIKSLHDQARFLENRLEKHILGNHLFANCKALIFAGIYISSPDSDRWLKNGLKILQSELNEQVLDDGGNFELSPMYHLIFLEDLLDISNLLGVYEIEISKTLKNLIDSKISKMILWMKYLIHPDGSLVLFNDCAENIASTFNDIVSYAERLKVDIYNEENSPLVLLKDSGYARYKNNNLSVFIDIAKIGPDYLPGHGHADLFSYEVSFYGQRVFVNSGTSCYGSSKRRIFERSTSAHNTVEINNTNSSDVWAGFRVANRAYPEEPKLISNSESAFYSIKSSHKGYSSLFNKITHSREWIFYNGSMEVLDQIEGPFRSAISRIYLHPKVKVIVIKDNLISLELKHKKKINLELDNAKFFITKTKFSSNFGDLEDNFCINIQILDNKKVKLIIKY